MAYTYTDLLRSDISRAIAATSRAGVGVGPMPGVPDNRLPFPAMFMVDSTTRTTANLSWNAVPGASSYAIQRQLDGTNAPWVTIPSARFTSSTGARDTGLTAGNAYLYRISAIHSDPTRNSDWSNPILAICPPPVGDTRLLAPTSPSVDRTTTNTALMSWVAAAGADGYEARWRPTGADRGDYTYSGRLGTGLSYTMSENISPGVNYLASVRTLAPNAINNSQWSAEVPFRTAALAPTPPVNRIDTPSNIRLVTAGERLLTVQCDPIANNRGYKWRYWESGNQRTQRELDSASTTITLPNLKRNMAYKVQVKGLKNVFTPDSVGDSSWSAPVTFRTTARGTDRAYRAMSCAPRVTQGATTAASSLTLTFRFPGGDTRVGPDANVQLFFTVQLGTDTKISETLTQPIGLTAAGSSFTMSYTKSGFGPEEFPFDDYVVKWNFTINSKPGPGGTTTFLNPRRASGFTGTLISNSRTRGSTEEWGYRKGQYGDVIPAGSPINAIYEVTTRRGFIVTREMFINITGNWTQVIIGGKRYNRNQLLSNGKARVNIGGIPRYNGGRASITLR